MINSQKTTDATLVHLSEQFSQTEVFLVGTMNESNFLAERTKQLIRQVKPDTVMVQANESFDQIVKKMGYASSQEEMDAVRKELYHTQSYQEDEKFGWNIFRAKFYFGNVALKSFWGLPLETNPTLPGIEAKFAVEEAERVGAKKVFLGPELDQTTWRRLHHENRVSVAKFLKNFLTIPFNYRHEKKDRKFLISRYGWRSYVEARMDTFEVNWFIKTMEILMPQWKRIFIEKKEEDLFKAILANRGKTSVVLVNQWHLEGLEHHWCHAYGQTPRSAEFKEIDPIGDMNYRELLVERAFHVLKRDIKTGRCSATPASYTNFIYPYNREGTFQVEHRNM